MPKISALTSLAQASVDTAADVLPIVDATAPATTKKVTVQAMVNAGLAAAAPQGGTLALTGALTVSGQASFAAGTAAAPSVKVGTGNEGLYSLAAGTLGLTANGRLALRLETVASSVNYLYGYANSTGGAPVLRALGSDTNVSLILSSQGTGSVDVFTNGATAGQFRVNHVANSVNIIQAAGAATGGTPSFAVGGTDTDIPFAYYTKGTGTHQFLTGGGLQAVVGDAVSAVNYWMLTGSATGDRPAFRVQGSDTNIGVYLATKGTGSWRFATGGGDQFRILNAANAVNYFSAYGAATGNGPTLFADGSDAAVNANYSLKGSGSHVFYTGTTTAVQFAIGHVASAVNYLQAQGAATGASPILFATGSDPNVNLIYSLKGAGAHAFYTNSTTAPQFFVAHTASAANYVQATGAATGNAVTISAQGSDTNIDFALTTKGTGVLRFGTHSALAGETVTGYITIKDSAGNTRKLAVLS